MNLDEILDFLFHRIKGIMITVFSAIIITVAMTGCLPLDFCGCWWVGCGGGALRDPDSDDYYDDYYYALGECDFCAEACFEFADCFDELCHEIFGVCGDCALNNIVFGDGHEAECGTCYFDCGGLNEDFFYHVCFGDYGFGRGCYEEEGHSRYECANCFVYCDGVKDPASPNFQQVFLFDLTYVDYNGNSQTVSIYENTRKLPYNTEAGLTFRGYFSEPGGLGVQFTDESGYIITLPNSTDVAYSYYIDEFTGNEYTIKVLLPMGTDENGVIYPSGSGENAGEQSYIQRFTIRYQGDLSAVLPMAPSVDGYDFIGWKALCPGDGSVKKIGDGTGLYTEFRSFNPRSYGMYDPNSRNIITFSPVYEKHRFDVTVVYPSGSSTDGYVYGSLMYEVLPTWEYNYPDKIFVGFSRVEDSTDEAHLYYEDSIITEDCTVYAVYRNKVHLYPYCRDTIDGELVQGETWVVAAGVEYEFEDPGVDIPGYRFVGWRVKGTTEQPFTKRYVDESWEGRELEPVYETATYTIKYYVDGVYWTSDSYHLGDTLNLSVPTANPYKDFIGWSMYEDGSGSTYMTLPQNIYGDIGFYACFTPKTFTINMDARGGILSNTTKSVQYGATEFTLGVPTRANATFLGWYYNAGSREVQITDNRGYSVIAFDEDAIGVSFNTSNYLFNVHAKWEINEYDVYFYGLNDQLITSVKVEHGGTVSAPQDPTAKGHTFRYWTTYNGSQYDFGSKVTGELKLYAKFDANVYNIKLNLGSYGEFADGSNEITVTYTYGSNSVIGLSSFTQYNEDLSFGGWYYRASGGDMLCISPNGQVTLNIFEYITDGMTLYAVFW